MTLGMEVGLGQGYIVLDGNPAPLPKKGAEPPNFQLIFYCGQTAGCIKMPLGTEVDLGASHIRWGPSSPRKGHNSPPSFRPMSIVATVVYLSYC